MAKSAPFAQLFIVHGRNLSGDIGSFSELLQERETLDVTPINKSAHERLIGLAGGAMDFDAFFNDASEQSFDSLKQLPSTDVIGLWAQSSTIQDNTFSLVSKQENFALSRGAEGALGLQGRLASTGGFSLEHGRLLTAGIATHSSATTGSSVDKSAAGSNGFSAYLHIIDIASGTPTVTIEMDDNSGFTSTTQLIAFTAVADGAEPTAEHKTTLTNPERYLRIVTTGTFTGLDFIIATRYGSANDIPGLIT